MTDVVSYALDVSSREFPKETPSQAPQTGQRRSRRRPRAEFIRDIRRLVVTSWLAKTGQQWRWTAYDRECLYQLAMRIPAWEIMALWDCYIDQPWRECTIPHFVQGFVLDRLRDDVRAKTLADLYRKRLYCKLGREVYS